MMKNTPRIFAIFLALLATCSHAQAATEFFYTSSPQSWVGAGQTVTVSPATGFDFMVTRNFDNGVSFVINDFASNPDFQAKRWWYLDFSAPLDAPLAIGSYQHATRWSFQAASDPGLAFSGNGRGDNTLTGSFNVLEIEYGLSGALLAFAADFIQYDEGMQSAWNAGSIRYNSAIPINAVPVPGAVLLFASGLGALVTFVRRRRAV